MDVVMAALLREEIQFVPRVGMLRKVSVPTPVLTGSGSKG